MHERTLILVKPDAYKRRLVGEILARLQRSGLQIDDIRLSENEKHITSEHYPRDESWLRIVGGKTLSDHEELGLSVKDNIGTDDALEIGRLVRGWLVESLQSAPIIAVILSGNRAIETVRKIVGSTLPVAAAPGTIRGDLSSDSTDLANDERRPVSNLVHASGNPDEAEREIALWFSAS